MPRGRLPGNVPLADLDLAGRDAASLAAAMRVVGTEPLGPSSRPGVNMPRPQPAPLGGLSYAGCVERLPPPVADEPAQDPCARMMAELGRDRRPGVATPTPAAAPAASPPAEACRDASPAAPDAAQLDPCLVRLIAVWHRLPKKIQDAISAIVQSTERAACGR